MLRGQLIVLSCFLAACAAKPAVSSTVVAEPSQPAFDPLEHIWVTGSGQPTELSAFAEGLADTDLLAFGELHGHPLANRYELELLELLHAQERPVALAMEFFERDQQATLDAYLAGEIEEAEFLEATKRSEAYSSSHRPLIEFCKAQGIPVIAANAQRALVTGYRKSEVSYEDYIEGLSEEERGWLPRSTNPPDDEHKARFMKAMAGSGHGESFFKSMALWNDAMAETMADFRERAPEHRVLLVVGAFHVQKHLGTITAYAERRVDDEIKVLVSIPSEDPDLVFTEDQRGEGDLVLLLRPPQ